MRTVDNSSPSLRIQLASSPAIGFRPGDAITGRIIRTEPTTCARAPDCLTLGQVRVKDHSARRSGAQHIRRPLPLLWRRRNHTSPVPRPAARDPARKRRVVVGFRPNDAGGHESGERGSGPAVQLPSPPPRYSTGAPAGLPLQVRQEGREQGGQGDRSVRAVRAPCRDPAAGPAEHQDASCLSRLNTSFRARPASPISISNATCSPARSRPRDWCPAKKTRRCRSPRRPGS
jgi:hypothetical protein